MFLRGPKHFLELGSHTKPHPGPGKKKNKSASLGNMAAQAVSAAKDIYAWLAWAASHLRVSGSTTNTDDPKQSWPTQYL